MRNVLVTGGLGFIGLNFIKYWQAQYPDDHITVLDKYTYASNPSEYWPSDIMVVMDDICDKEIVDRTMHSAELVVHFAAESHVDNSISNSSPFIQTNIVGTHNLLESAVKHKVKHFHHVSTDEVFGSLALRSKKLFTEETKYDPRSPYSASKASSDHLVRAYHTTYGLPITITNCSNNYGPYQHKEKLLPKVILNALDDEKIPVYGDGQNVRDWLYVTDHCSAIDTVINKGNIGETYLVGGSEVSNLTIIKSILKYMNKDESLIEFVKDRPGHDRRYAIDCSKLKKLGWKAEVDLEEGLKKTINWYKN